MLRERFEWLVMGFTSEKNWLGFPGLITKPPAVINKLWEWWNIVLSTLLCTGFYSLLPKRRPNFSTGDITFYGDQQEERCRGGCKDRSLNISVDCVTEEATCWSYSPARSPTEGCPLCTYLRMYFFSRKYIHLRNVVNSILSMIPLLSSRTFVMVKSLRTLLILSEILLSLEKSPDVKLVISLMNWKTKKTTITFISWWICFISTSDYHKNNNRKRFLSLFSI